MSLGGQAPGGLSSCPWEGGPAERETVSAGLQSLPGF